jgi:uncharacterized protein YbaR (Trm112 family)
VSNDNRVADGTSSARSASPRAAASALEPWIVALLACPLDRGAVRLDQGELICIRCGRRYPVQSGIPAMVVDIAADEQKF